jgi:hypothetical protein
MCVSGRERKIIKRHTQKEGERKKINMTIMLALKPVYCVNGRNPVIQISIPSMIVAEVR